MSGWVFDVLEALGYLGLVLVLIAENLFPPIPSEVILPLAGFLVGQGSFSFAGALAASTLGAVLGALALYAMGRYGGRPLVLRYGSWLRVDEERLDRAERWFAKYGDAVVLWARMVPLARSVVSIPAGMARMPLLRFTVLTAMGSAVWNALLIGCGWALGANWERVSEVAGAYSDAVVATLAAGAAGTGLYYLIRYRGSLASESGARGELARRMGTVLAGAGASAFAYVLYLRTLAPTVVPYELPDFADVAMLQMQACVLGITHPTGYPMWTMLTHLLTHLPFGDCAYRTNLASAIYAALAVAAVYTAGLLLTRRVVAAAAGALAFGTGTTLWSQAVIAEVYTINALTLALTLIALLLWRETRRDHHLLLSAFLVGLSMTNHMTSGLFLPASLLFVALVDRSTLARWRLVAGGAAAFALGLVPYLYLPIRTSLGAPMVANKPDSLGRFLDVVSGGDLRGGFFAFGLAELPGRLALYGEHLLENFNWFLVAAGLVGFGALLLWDRAAAALTGFLFAGWAFHAIENNIVDVQIYFIPTYVVFALWISVGFALVLEEAEVLLSRSRRARQAATAVFGAAFLLLPLAGVGKAHAANDLSDEYRGRDINAVVAEHAAPEATVLHLRSSLWYMLLVEERRQDLTIVDPFQGYEGSYNDVVWPEELSIRAMHRRYGTHDGTGTTAARKILRDGGPLYLLAHPGLDTQRFREVGLRPVHVEGPLYELRPPDGTTLAGGGT